jgi:solute carrier family 35 protein F5
MSFDQQHHHHHAQQHKSNTTTDADASMMAEELPILYWTNRQHIHAAARIAPVWFLTNFAFNEALALTSISSCMTLASTTSAFAFALEVCLGQAQFHVFKLLGVLFGILGMIFMAIHDSRAQEEGEEFHSVTGDWIALGAAFGYAAYAVQVRVLCPANERYSMKLILGYIGFFILIGLAPIALGVVMTHGGMTGRAFGFAILRGLLDYVLCEYLFFRSVILTSATVASVGLGLTIPLAFLADFILGTDDIISFYSVSGALLVLLGFLAVNLGCNDCEDDSVDESYPVNNNGKAQPLLEKESSLETRKHGNETEKQVL